MVIARGRLDHPPARLCVYGRYLTDVNYLPVVADPPQVLRCGTYLSRQLREFGLAVRYLD